MNIQNIYRKQLNSRDTGIKRKFLYHCLKDAFDAKIMDIARAAADHQCKIYAVNVENKGTQVKHKM